MLLVGAGIVVAEAVGDRLLVLVLLIVVSGSDTVFVSVSVM
jgi:hypothetical protein